MHINDYDSSLSDEEILAVRHRELVGGLWDEIGRLQFEFMCERGGLQSGMRLLDLGCGCFRGGVHFIPYLVSGNYYAMDVNDSLVAAGLTVELPRAGLCLAADRVLVTDNFDARHFGVNFDRVLAVSVWTHLPLNHIQRCLAAVSNVLAPGGVFYTSVFLCQTKAKLLEPNVHERGGIISHRDRDPYHYQVDDFEFLLRQLSLPLRLELLGEWSHPRDQQMLAFYRT